MLVIDLCENISISTSSTERKRKKLNFCTPLYSTEKKVPIIWLQRAYVDLLDMTEIVLY